MTEIVLLPTIAGSITVGGEGNAGWSTMRIRLIICSAAACLLFLLSCGQVFAQAALMSRAEKQVFHACLYADWIDRYCRFEAWGARATFTDCIIANNGCRCANLNGGYWGPEIDSVCAAVSRYHAR
jgi:hypothetical protein